MGVTNRVGLEEIISIWQCIR